MINHVSKDLMRLFNVNKFVETGILQGDTFMIVQDWFTEWYGPEFNSGPWANCEAPNGSRHPYPPDPCRARIYEVDFNQAVITNTIMMKTQGNVNTTVEMDESTSWLKRNVEGGEFASDDSVFFYLDAHDDSSLPEAFDGGSAVETSPNRQPLREEISEILKLKNRPIISIDDWRLTPVNEIPVRANVKSASCCVCDRPLDGETAMFFPKNKALFCYSCGHPDVYHVSQIKDLIADRTDVIYYTRYPNFHGKFSAFIFVDRREEELKALEILPLIREKL